MDHLYAESFAWLNPDTRTKQPTWHSYTYRLPPEHAAWVEPNLLLTPHVARSPEQPPYRWEPLFVENLRRFATDEPLLNVVDVDAGY